MPLPTCPQGITGTTSSETSVRHDLRGALTTIHAAATTLRTQREQLGPERVEVICALLEDRSRGAVRLLAQLERLHAPAPPGDAARVPTTGVGLSPDA